jgi:hypothetical protein
MSSTGEKRPGPSLSGRLPIGIGVDALADELARLVDRLSATNLRLSLHLFETAGLAPGLGEALLRRVVGPRGRITQISPYDYVVTLLGPDSVLLRGDSLPQRLADALGGLLGPDAPALRKVKVRSLQTSTHEIVDPSWLLNELGTAPLRPLPQPQ